MATVTDAARQPADHESLSRTGFRTLRPRRHRRRTGLVDLAMSDPDRPTLVLRYAYVLGVLLIGAPGWRLLTECMATPRAVLFVSPSARLARIPWGLLAVPKSGPSKEELVRAPQDAITASGRGAAH